MSSATRKATRIQSFYTRYQAPLSSLWGIEPVLELCKFQNIMNMIVVMYLMYLCSYDHK